MIDTKEWSNRIVAYCREYDWEACLKSAFVERGGDFIIIDDRMLGNKFLMDTLNYGLKQKWLYRAPDEDRGRNQGC